MRKTCASNESVNIAVLTRWKLGRVSSKSRNARFKFSYFSQWSRLPPNVNRHKTWTDHVPSTCTRLPVRKAVLASPTAKLRWWQRFWFGRSQTYWSIFCVCKQTYSLKKENTSFKIWTGLSSTFCIRWVHLTQEKQSARECEAAVYEKELRSAYAPWSSEAQCSRADASCLGTALCTLVVEQRSFKADSMVYGSPTVGSSYDLLKGSWSWHCHWREVHFILKGVKLLWWKVPTHWTAFRGVLVCYLWHARNTDVMSGHSVWQCVLNL